MSNPPVLFETQDLIAQITLNRPENRNSMDKETMPAFLEAINRVKDDNNLRCLIITGTGKSFCAGADFKSGIVDDRGALPHETLLKTYGPFLKIQEIKIPTIAAMNGHAVGGGFGLGLICDIRIANIDSKYGANFARLGLHTGMAISYMLPRIVGMPVANELLFTGRLIDGKTAADIGLANYALRENEVSEKAWELAREIAACAPAAVRMIKRSVHRDLDWDPAGAAEAEAYCQSRTFEMDDAREGISALLEKREPVFKGE
ncbi:MAG: enoyl-CoA hydratase/isomerase family protein [Deltaproteobacteria bacterium]|nr:enoyl-CoA hydratase/isomerase family protein [Deltaproteobacteria bacterium]MBW2596345.1 enoyl-CoA hydratase/isomerase family protein [Deltaproteobacteria bacterium]